MGDASVFGGHWLDVAVTALLALVGYFANARFSDMERRHERAEDKIEALAEDISELKEKIAGFRRQR